jgi:hypothetical protein
LGKGDFFQLILWLKNSRFSDAVDDLGDAVGLPDQNEGLILDSSLQLILLQMKLLSEWKLYGKVLAIRC